MSRGVPRILQGLLIAVHALVAAAVTLHLASAPERWGRMPEVWAAVMGTAVGAPLWSLWLFRSGNWAGALAVLLPLALAASAFALLASAVALSGGLWAD